MLKKRGQIYFPFDEGSVAKEKNRSAPFLLADNANLTPKASIMELY